MSQETANPQQNSDDNQIDSTTNELLSHDWEEIYGVLFVMKNLTETYRDKTLELLISKPKLAMALYQAQMELGIACTQMPQEQPQPQAVMQDQQYIQRCLIMTLGEFYTLTPEQQEYVKNVRATYGYPQIPLQ